MIPGPARPALRKGYWWVHRRTLRVRRSWFILRVRLVAMLRHAQVELVVARGAELGRRVRVDIDPNTSSRVVLTEGSRIQDDVVLWLRGGTFELGERSALRRGVRVNTSGHLGVGDDVVVSWGAVLHCAERVTIGDMTIIGEYSTITDSTHRRTSDQPIRDHVRTAPSVIGRNVWLGASVVVASGVEIGDRAVIASHSVVTTDVAAQWLAAGAPARAVRYLEIDEVD